MAAKQKEFDGIIQDPSTYREMLVPHESVEVGADNWAKFYEERPARNTASPTSACSAAFW